MELRQHPVMFCDGVKVWPPKWLQTHGPRAICAFGEIGILDEVFISRRLINKVYVLMTTEEGNSYIGTLLFEQAHVTQEVYNLLLTCVHKPLAAIGALDLPDSFSE